MITYNTQFPIEPSSKASKLIDVAIKWIGGSPYTHFSEEDLASISKVGSSYIQHESPYESLETIILTDDGKEYCGVQYVAVDKDNICWKVELVGEQKDNDFTVSVQVSYDTTAPLAKIPRGNKPRIIQMVLEEFNAGFDSYFKVQDAPFLLDENENGVIIASKTIEGTLNNSMPIVYVSACDNDKPYIDIGQLSEQLSGLAHVMVEPSRDFSFKLKKPTNNKNVYGGAIAIYWPNGIGRKILIPTGKYKNPSFLSTDIEETIKKSLAVQRLKKECTWAYLKETVNRRRIRKIKEDGLKRLEEYKEIEELYEQEIKAKDEEVARAEEEILRLKNEIAKLDSQDKSFNTFGIIKPGQEVDLYPGEINDFVLESLERSLRDAEDNSRSQNIYKDLLGVNDKVGNLEDYRSRLKEILKNYQSLDAKTRRFLENMGFSIDESGKHHKLIFMDDKRYPCSLPKTSSDSRAGKNMRSDISHKLF